MQNEEIKALLEAFVSGLAALNMSAHRETLLATRGLFNLSEENFFRGEDFVKKKF